MNTEETNVELETPMEFGEANTSEDLKEIQEPILEKKDTTTIPQAILDEARKKYGNDQVEVLALPKDDFDRDYLDVLVRVPSIFAVGEYEKYVDRNPLKAKKILIEFCVLTSKAEILADHGLFNACVNGLAELIPIRKAIRKNL